MNVPTGFLVVRSIKPAQLDDEEVPRYAGVNRVPTYPSDDEREQAALDEYVFGDYKDEETNLIPTLEAAVRLQRSLTSGKHRFEILFCCENPEASQRIEGTGVHIEHLGYDVAGVRGDGWSIVDDFPPSEWATHFRNRLNEFGLFARKVDAEAYLREYCGRREPDNDSAFDVVYVARVMPYWVPSHGGRDPGHPYRWRTWLRGRLPWFLINLGIAAKGEDCEAVGGWHRWYNVDGQSSGCYHCEVVRPGRLWRGGEA